MVQENFRGQSFNGCFGVFDGHGGQRAAEYARLHLPGMLAQHPELESNVMGTVKKGKLSQSCVWCKLALRELMKESQLFWEGGKSGSEGKKRQSFRKTQKKRVWHNPWEEEWQIEVQDHGINQRLNNNAVTVLRAQMWLWASQTSKSILATNWKLVSTRWNKILTITRALKIHQMIWQLYSNEK